MAILNFSIEELEKIALELEEQVEFTPTYEQSYYKEFWKEGAQPDTDQYGLIKNLSEIIDKTKVPAGFFFVKDRGIYLMSNAANKEMVDGSYNVVYADGYSPDDEDWYEKARNAVGGDDFSLYIPAEWFSRAKKAGTGKLTLLATEDSITLI
jgi:hypothetical protein